MTSLPYIIIKKDWKSTSNSKKGTVSKYITSYTLNINSKKVLPYESFPPCNELLFELWKEKKRNKINF